MMDIHNSKIAWIFVLQITLVFGARSCDQKPIPECTCWHPKRPSICCVDIGLSSFPNLTSDYIYSLDLSFNNIVIIPGEKLGHHDLVLVTLKLSKALAQTSNGLIFPESFFSNVNTSLTWVDLSRNSFEKVPQELNQLGELVYLDLAENKIKTIQAESFSGMTKLTSLYLAENPLMHINDVSFSAFKLLSLSVTFKLPSSIQFTTYLNNLEWLHIVDSELLDNSNITQFFTSFINLKQLQIVHSPLIMQHIQTKPNAFSVLSDKLKILKLSGNRLTSVPVKLLESLPNIQSVDLSANRIQSVDKMSCMNDLKKLDLGTNSIVDMGDLDQFMDTRCFTSLTSISLRNNSVEFLSRYICDQLGERKVKVTLGHNPLRCECDVTWVAWDLEPGHGVTTCIEVNDAMSDLYCDTPLSANGKLVLEVAEFCT